MNLQDVAMTNFIFFQPSWSVASSHSLLETLKPSHVIVRRYEPDETYYLLLASDVLDQLAQAPDTAFAEQELRLDASTRVPALDGESDADEAPDRCVVLEEHSLTGFFDVSAPFLQPPTRRPGTDQNEVPPQNVSLVTQMKEKVQIQQPFSLLISLSALPTLPSNNSFFIDLPAGSVIDIVVQTELGITIESGNGEVALVVPAEGKTLPWQCKLRGVKPGLARVWVQAFFQGRWLGKLTLKTLVQEEQVLTQQFASYERLLEPVRLQYPDLSLWIEEHAGSKLAFTFRLTAADPSIELYWKQFGPTPLRTEPQRYFQEFFREIETITRTNDDAATRDLLLASKGMHLFEELLPADLQALLWDLKGRIRTVQVQTVEPWIPWELCKLCGKENGRIVEGPFFGEAFAITRWLQEIPCKPRLSLHNMAVVAPRDSGLWHVPDERDYLLSLRDHEHKVKVIPANLQELYKVLKDGTYDGLHFSGHGKFAAANANRSVMYLERDETLTPEHLQGPAKNLGLARPLVFLNACQLGRSALALTGVGGWARQFLRAGAGAFVGAYWSIDDTTAASFARAFYRLLLGGLPIGEAARQARIEIKAPGETTWLAYTIFADPLAIVEARPSLSA
jgi:CHAT domain